MQIYLVAVGGESPLIRFGRHIAFGHKPQAGIGIV